MERATFGAGCFWGIEVRFRNVEGVTDVVVGYAGGHTPDPTYERVLTGTTGHAEVVQVTFDPDVVSYEQLLDVFFRAHDPTQVNRQGPDIGAQYRSLVIAHDERQRRAVEARIRALDSERPGGRPIATQVLDDLPFHPAEEYHQRFLIKRGLASCRV